VSTLPNRATQKYLPNGTAVVHIYNPSY
jgi:hypothetical protein